MLNGMMIHSEFADYYCFLGIKHYADMHEERFCDESKAYRKLCRFYLTTHNKLLSKPVFNYESIIPQSWYKYKRSEVDVNTLRNSVNSGIETWETWETWERETKSIYQKMYSALLELNEIDSAAMLKTIIFDVSEELKHAEQKHLRLKAMDYSVAAIFGE